MQNDVTETDVRFMRRALKLARLGMGRTSPNPMVGAVIVRQGKVLAEGWHKAPGRPHAEAEALAKLGGKAKGATMYVNLEPCIHYGRTGPCSPAIARAGIKRVVVAVIDPNPLVSGKGIDYLNHRNIQTVVGVLKEQATELNRAFFKHISQGQPWVTLKMAMTMDGRIADRWGHSKYLSNAKSLYWVHRKRTISDAIMVGIGTVLADDPMLTPRGVRVIRRPIRVVLDSGLRLPMDSKLVKTAGDVPVWVYHCEGDKDRLEALEAAGCRVVKVPCRHGELRVNDVLTDLGAHDVQNLLVEGGSHLAASMVRDGLWDELALFVTPKIAVDTGAIPVFAGLGPRPVGAFSRVSLKRVRRFDDDTLLIYRKA